MGYATIFSDLDGVERSAELGLLCELRQRQTGEEGAVDRRLVTRQEGEVLQAGEPLERLTDPSLRMGADGRGPDPVGR